MLGLVAAQLRYQEERGRWTRKRPVWIDIGGGTGYNVESMQAYLDVPTFFAKVYLVDLSPSLLEVARKRFERLGWDIEIVCQDARTFRLEDYEAAKSTDISVSSLGSSCSDRSSIGCGADLVTMSYSLSMIPDYYSVLDSIPSLLSSDGIIGVVDFYVQSIVEISGRTYTGGSFNRHVTWIKRVFWRAWFDVDRVGLEGARRDYLEYRFGTLKSVDDRNYLLGGIPYYSGLFPSTIEVRCCNTDTLHSIPRHTARTCIFHEHKCRICAGFHREFRRLLHRITLPFPTEPQSRDVPSG